ncbi:MAG: tRNA(His) guanylyltransferase Thg1 family protein [Anaeroplasmataceae bacterium]|nr:tRNA(His) guanylyltransferase Thg1 family protein [Anaeroplasmataceae bacterium]
MNPVTSQIKYPKINNYTYPSAKRNYSKYKNMENEFNILLKEDSYYIVRFDGKGMTREYRQENHSINAIFFKTMKKVFKTFCENNSNIIFGYCFSDEVSILIKGASGKKAITSRVEKILSLYASELSVLFYKTAKENQLEVKSSLFDARILKVEKENIISYFCTRQEFAICNFLQLLRDKHKIDRNIIQSSRIIKELNKKNVHYYNQPAEYRFGLAYSPKQKILSFEFVNNLNVLESLISLEKVANH